jgi:DDE superfamily endonuclease
MSHLPKRIIPLVRPFECALSEGVWEWAKVLLIGAILAPGERTVTAILRVMGLSQEKQFHNCHRVLSRARWSSRALSRILLRLLVEIFVSPDAPIVVGIDETIERRRGAKIAARGIYRDPVRSSKELFVKTSGLRSRLDDALGSYPLGEPSVGVAVSDGAGSFRTVQ